MTMSSSDTMNALFRYNRGDEPDSLLRSALRVQRSAHNQLFDPSISRIFITSSVLVIGIPMILL